MDSKVKFSETNPVDKANILSKLFVTWSFKLFYKGFKQPLTLNDLYNPSKKDLSDRLGDKLETAWKNEIRQAKATGGKPSLSKAIVKVFWLNFMLWGFAVGILFIVLWPLLPFTLSLFIAYFSGERNSQTYTYAHVNNFLLNLLSVATALFFNHTNLGQSIVGMRVRIAACSLMYRKLLKMDRKSLNITAPGQVVNLMSNDVTRFDIAASLLNFLWVMPIMVPVVCYFVWQHIQYAILASLAVIFFQTVLVQAYLSNKQGVLRGKIAKRTDERVKVMSELVNGVQVIKMYAWEKPFEKLVAHLRKLEVDYILKTSLIKGFSSALAVFTERMILYAGVVTFVVTGGDITSEITFSLVQYFNLLQLGCNIFFPMALATLSEANVSVRRIEEFLALEELTSLKDGGPIPELANGEVKSKPTGVVLRKASASWLQDSIVDTLSGIDLTIRPGELLGVCGPVGSGKSSILQVLIGELPLTKGSISLGGARVSYASQEPWLFVATVKENILFGQPYDKLRYKKVIKACALVRDFELLPNGDSTMVGERGISLSGGQRARIGLARAVYRQADLYLLDDPLSAVDTHVGKHLVSECVNGFLRDKTRILVTHQLHHLKTADNIIVMRHGKIELEGKFQDVSRNPLFSELLEEEENEDKALEKPRQRTMSIQSHTSLASVLDMTANEDEEPGETSELMEKGRVSGSVYMQYFRAGGGWCLLVFTLLSAIAAQLVTSAGDLWLTHWMNNVEAVRRELPLNENGTVRLTNIVADNLTLNDSLTSSTEKPNNTIVGDFLNTLIAIRNETGDSIQTHPEHVDIDNSIYIYIWTAFIIACIIMTTERAFVFLWVCTRSSIKLHNSMFSNILQATMRFFDSNPSGRILNRFSKDMGLVDELLPRLMMDSMQVFLVMTGILVMVAIVSPYQLLTTGICALLMYLLTIVYLNTAQSIRRIEGVARSPVFSHVTESMAGLSTVRASNAQLMLQQQFDLKQDVHTAAWYLTLVTNCAFSIWLSLISAAYVLVVSYTFLLGDDGTTQSGDVGLAISQSLIMVNMVQYGIKNATDVIAQMTSVERVMQYMKLPQEYPLTSPPAKPMPADWPKRGKVVFKNLYLKYVEGDEPVLKNLNLVIESGWKVGVVGRTGAGKSSLIGALFRLAPLEGQVLIDDVDTSTLALRDLRSKISIIPQEPVLFSATLRYNLDPFDKHSDADIWRTLEMVELKSSVSSLSSEVTEGGSNYSAGQRQLLCLARAALNRNRVLVLDEATANVDPTTDSLIQKTIRTHFNDCTVITVAHRLHTVADSDRILVMDAGQAVQFGHPYDLLQVSEGVFAQMVKQMGPAAEQSLTEVAKKAYEKHIKYVDAD